MIDVEDIKKKQIITEQDSVEVVDLNMNVDSNEENGGIGIEIGSIGIGFDS